MVITANMLAQKESFQSKSVTHGQTMKDLVRTLDMNNQADMLLATREDIQKCKIRDNDISDNTIHQVYTQASMNYGIQPQNGFQLLMHEKSRVQHFKTGVEE